MSVLVSVLMITYQHEEFISEAIESVLNQKCSFEIELIIANDNSSDRTEGIVKKFIQSHPNGRWIRYFRHDENIGMTKNLIFAWDKARGNYIALCEGDDYWIDKNKISKQIDFLLKNNDYNLVSTAYKILDSNTNKISDVITIPKRKKINANGYSFVLKDTVNLSIVRFLTATFVNSADLFDSFKQYTYARDIHLFYHLLKSGKAFHFIEIMGVYRIHEGGIFSMKHGKVNIYQKYYIDKELYSKNKDEFTRFQFMKSTLRVINYNMYGKEKNESWRAKIMYFKEAIKLFKKTSDIIYFLVLFLPPKLKLKLRGLSTRYYR